MRNIESEEFSEDDLAKLEVIPSTQSGENQEYNKWAMSHALHRQVFTTGDSVTVLNPNGDGRDQAFSILEVVATNENKRRENPTGEVYRLSNNGGDWEAKDLIYSSRVSSRMQTSPLAPAPVPTDRPQEPVNEDSPQPQPTQQPDGNEFDEMDLGLDLESKFENSTDYLYSQILSSFPSDMKVARRTTQRKGPLSFLNTGADILFNCDIPQLARAFKRREHLRCSLSKTPFSKESKPGFAKLEFSK